MKFPKLPRIGLRMVKSAIAVFICFIVYYFFRPNGIVFYSQLAVLWCIQPLRESTLSKAWQRAIGTLNGALFGLVAILIDQKYISSNKFGNLIYAALTSLCIIAIIYVTLLIKKRDASYFSCVVFLSIVVNHIGDVNPYIFVFNRVLDTMIGIAIGMLINGFHLPRRKRKDILFVSGMDDTLLSSDEKLSAYSIVELNRMIADGVKFTLSTGRTPASIIEPMRGIHLKLPVIAMNGAVLYDICKHEYRYAYIINKELTEKLTAFLDQYDVNYFLNILLDNILIIQYKELKNEAEKDIYQKLSQSPYRNYTNKNFLNAGECIYFMLVEHSEVIEEIYHALLQTDMSRHVKMITYPSHDYEGYAYIKIYNKNASRKNMLEYLKKDTQMDNVVTFGTIEGQYDVLIDKNDSNQVVKILKKMYEPVFWKQN